MLIQAGQRIELISTTDPHTDLKPGALGTVSMIDSLGTVHVNWDSGSTLGLVPGQDVWRVATLKVSDMVAAFDIHERQLDYDVMVDLGPDDELQDVVEVAWRNQDRMVVIKLGPDPTGSPGEPEGWRR